MKIEYMKKRFDKIDSAVFTGGFLKSRSSRAMFKKYVADWMREIERLEQDDHNGNYIDYTDMDTV